MSMDEAYMQLRYLSQMENIREDYEDGDEDDDKDDDESD